MVIKSILGVDILIVFIFVNYIANWSVKNIIYTIDCQLIIIVKFLLKNLEVLIQF